MTGFNPFEDKPDAFGIFKIQTQSIPEIIFEYHPQVKKVYAVVFEELAGVGLGKGELIAEEVPDSAAAAWIARAFVGGYKYANRKTTECPSTLLT
jgi:hypothetical protein